MPGSGKNIRRILLVRNDRLGDLVLTTPAFEALRLSMPQARIDLLCSAYAAPVVNGNPNLDEVITDHGAHDSRDLDSLVREVRGRNYDCAVVFVRTLKNARLVRRSRIPLRIGPWVRPLDPLYFSHPLRQRRSRGEKNEAAYNLDLLAPLGVDTSHLPPPFVAVREETKREAESCLSGLFDGIGRNKLIGVHPGMGGSALNWPEDRWRELVEILAARGNVRILLTGSDTERGLLERVGQGCGEQVRLAAGLPLELFIGVLGRLSAFCAPSTGPLHLAAALGVSTAGIYSPVRAHHPRRWGPLGPRARVFLPPVDCTAELACRDNCGDSPCMGLIEAQAVARCLLEEE